MAIQRAIKRGLNYLRLSQQSDGGIPATTPGAPSGCWTTAETLETTLLIGRHARSVRCFCERTIAFLTSSQISTGMDKGGWPLVAGGARASTMATGHAVAALELAIRYFEDEPDIQYKVKEILDPGVLWLQEHRNTDGGWGVEPAGGSDGSVTRMISTVYALRGFIRGEKTIENSRTVWDGVQAIMRLKRADGGFAPKADEPSDACNTARAITTLIRSKYGLQNPAVVRQGRAFVLRCCPTRELWVLDRETYVTAGAAGQTIYNANTTADVLEMFMELREYHRRAQQLVQWFIRSQADDGSWPLGANAARHEEIRTWPTNEAIAALAQVDRVLESVVVPRLRQGIRYWRRVSVALTLATVLLLLFVVRMPDWAVQFWHDLPDWVRTLIVTILGLGVGLNLLSSLLYDSLQSWRHRRRERRNGA